MALIGLADNLKIKMGDELISVGDRELHIVKGKIPNGEWTLPVYIDYLRSDRKEYAKITPALPVTAEQHGYLWYTFSLHNAWKKRDAFLIERHFLEQFTEKAPGITPEYYFRWPGAITPSTGKKRLKIHEADLGGDEPNEEREDFIDWVCKRRAVDKNVLRLAIDIISREAPYWLMQKQRPIDLGFTRIFAVPYRANWKEILLTRFRDIVWVFNSNKETRDNALRQVKFHEALCTLELMAIDRCKHHIYWTIEAAPTKQFEREMTEIEMTKQASGDNVYIRLYEKLVSSLSPRILEIFANYVQKISCAFPEVKRGVNTSSQKLVPYRGPKSATPQSGGNIPCHVVVEGGPQKLSKRERDAQVLISPINGLPKMPTIPSGTNNVRQRQITGPLGQSNNGQAGDVGLPVPATLESEPARLELLSLRQGENTEPVANGDKRE